MYVGITGRLRSIRILSLEDIPGTSLRRLCRDRCILLRIPWSVRSIAGHSACSHQDNRISMSTCFALLDRSDVHRTLVSYPKRTNPLDKTILIRYAQIHNEHLAKKDASLNPWRDMYSQRFVKILSLFPGKSSEIFSSSLQVRTSANRYSPAVGVERDRSSGGGGRGEICWSPQRRSQDAPQTEAHMNSCRKRKVEQA